MLHININNSNPVIGYAAVELGLGEICKHPSEKMEEKLGNIQKGLTKLL
jgi:hypothetical protein